LSWLRADLIAGEMVAAFLLPAGIRDPSLAGQIPKADPLRRAI